MTLDSIIIKLKKSYQKNLPQLNAYRKKLYSDFVFDSHAETIRGEIPVFTFHFLEPIQFEKQLQFLAANNYQTLKADEFLEMLIGNKSIPDRAVVLTFDDGWGSLWTYGYPLLKKYGMHGVSFIIPGIISEGGSYSPNLDDVWEGRVLQEQLVNRDNTAEPYCTWQEIREMSSTGTIEFQSHTMYHSLVFTSPHIVDFMNPSFDCYAGNHTVPIFSSNGQDNLSREVEWGTPVYTYMPRMGGSRRYFDDETLREKCIQFVRENGSRDFFRRRGWRRELHKLVKDYRDNIGDKGYYESHQELRESLYRDLVESKRLIEENIPRTIVKHLCYPYFVGSQLAVEVSRDAGYSCNYWGFLKERRSNCPGDDPYHIVRLNDDLIFRLPGYGRKSLQEILIQSFGNNYKNFLTKLNKQN